MKTITLSYLFFPLLHGLIILFVCFNFAFSQPHGESGLTKRSNNFRSMQSGLQTSEGFTQTVWDSEKGGSFSAKTDGVSTYSFDWDNVVNTIVGLGWRTGSVNRIVNFAGTLSSSQNGGTRLSLYGWTIGKCVEYYVMENWSGYTKPCTDAPAQRKGTYYSDGSMYTACEKYHPDRKCIDGSQGFYNFISVREDRRTSGQLSFRNHVNAWESYGMQLGPLTMGHIFATEAFGSTGSVTMSIEGST